MIGRGTFARRALVCAVMVLGALGAIALNASANHSQTDLISTGPNGGNGTPDAFYEGSSTDGGHVFLTTSEPLVSTDTDSSIDVYERFGTTTTLISTGPIGGNGAADARFAGVSADGTHVFFETTERLTSTDIDSVRDVYERFGGTTSEVSVRPSGGASTFDSFFVGYSTDGSHVFFVSYDNLTADDTDSGQKDVYDRSGGTTTLISKGSIGGSGAFGADFGGVTPDGLHVYFYTDEKLVASDTDSVRDVYERAAGVTARVSTGAINGNGAFQAFYEGVSQDGSRVFFESNEQLTSDDTDSYRDVYQRSGGTTTRISLGPDGGNGAFPATYQSASQDGSKVWMETREALLSGDTDGACEDDLGNPTLPCTDVYERSGGTTTQVSSGGNGSYDAAFADASQDGSRVFFGTSEPLDPSDNDIDGRDVYRRSGGSTTLISVAATGPSTAGFNAFLVGISKDGARVFFSTAEPMVSQDTDVWLDVYERYSDATTLISTGPASISGDAVALFGGASNDGTKVFFATEEQLTSGDTDSSQDVYSASQVVAGYPRPKSATPTLFPLVPAFQPCTSPNRVHDPVLLSDSCNPAQQASGVLTVGTPDANTFPAASTGSLKLKVIVGALGPPDDSDLQLFSTLKDVRCRATNAACPGGSGSAYTGKVLVSADVGLTDKANGSPAVESASGQFTLKIPVQCDFVSSTIGGSCVSTTSANALYPGLVLDAKRAIWALDDVKVMDAGPNGTGYDSGCPGSCGDGDETLFMRPGVFAP